MKNRRALIFAAAFGIVALFLNWFYLNQRDQQFEKRYGVERVLVAAKDIRRYRIIDSENLLKVQEIPKAYVQPDAVKESELALVLGYVAEATIKENEQITKSKLAPKGEGRISPLIPKEKRACTVAVNEVSGVAGLIRPGDHVDIIGVFRTVDEKTRAVQQAEAVTLLQNVPVLSVGRNYMFDNLSEQGKGKSLIATSSKSDLSFSNVTLAVEPRQCMDLVLAQQVGNLSLSLRSWLDRYGGKTDTALRETHSTTSSATGIEAPLEMTRQPKWLELRGTESTLVP